MALMHLDHASICTPNLAPLVEFYTNVVGLEEGPRPDFSFQGAWLYIGQQPCLHLIEDHSLPGRRQESLQLSHFAFRADHLKQFLEGLHRREIRYRVGIVEDFGICQINLFDPDGNHVHVDFPASEAVALGVQRSA